MIDKDLQEIEEKIDKETRFLNYLEKIILLPTNYENKDKISKIIIETKLKMIEIDLEISTLEYVA